MSTTITPAPQSAPVPPAAPAASLADQLNALIGTSVTVWRIGDMVAVEVHGMLQASAPKDGLQWFKIIAGEDQVRCAAMIHFELSAVAAVNRHMIDLRR